MSRDTQHTSHVTENIVHKSKTTNTNHDQIRTYRRKQRKSTLQTSVTHGHLRCKVGPTVMIGMKEQ